MWKTYYSPKSLEEAVTLISEHRNHGRIIAGATDLLLEMENGKRPQIDVLIDITRIPGLDHITIDDFGWIHIGPLVTHNQCVRSEMINERAFCLTRACWAVGSPQIRNRGTIAGNLITASPANDTISPLIALNAQVTLRSKSGDRVLPLRSFYTGVRKTVMKTDEIMIDIAFSAPPSTTRSIFMKVGLRKAQAISLVNTAVVLEAPKNRVTQVSIAMGSVAPTIVRAEEAEAYLHDKLLTSDVISEAGRLASETATPIDDIRASAWYRKQMVQVCTRRALTLLTEGKERDDFPEAPVMLCSPSSWEVKTPLDGLLIHDGEQPIRTTINGKSYTFRNEFTKTLLSLLREDTDLLGTKDGCTEGECGSCTVILDGKAVLSCLVPAPRAHGSEIVTVEGIHRDGYLHPIQEAFVREGGVQCGFCTPGLMMSGAVLLEERNQPSRDEIKQAIAGNLCRCTGYYNILAAFEKAADPNFQSTIPYPS
jgi:carbon-monoxide dehydrogenase medium subunit